MRTPTEIRAEDARRIPLAFASLRTCVVCDRPIPTRYSRREGRDVCGARCWQRLLAAQREEI